MPTHIQLSPPQAQAAALHSCCGCGSHAPAVHAHYTQETSPSLPHRTCIAVPAHHQQRSCCARWACRCRCCACPCRRHQQVAAVVQEGCCSQRGAQVDGCTQAPVQPKQLQPGRGAAVAQAAGKGQQSVSVSRPCARECSCDQAGTCRARCSQGFMCSRCLQGTNCVLTA